MKNIVCLLLVLFPSFLFSQPVEEFRTYKELAPNAKYVFTQYCVTIDLAIADGQPACKYSVTEEIMYLDNSASSYADRSISYSHFLDLVKYEAYSLVPAGNKYKRHDVEKFEKKTLVLDDAFHDDAVDLNFIMPYLEKGAKTVVKAGYNIADPHILPRFSINPFADFFNVTFTINHDPNIQLELDSFNLAEVKHSYTRTQKRNLIQHCWKFDAPKRLNDENSAPDYSYFAAQIVPRIKSYTANGIETPVLRDLADLHGWYCSLLKRSEESAAAFKSISDSIVGNSTADFDRARLIYDWVQKNIRYIAFEYGYAGFVPTAASEVYAKRYGDCKGMSNLLFNLLQSQDLDAHLCWVGTRNLPYKYSELPNTCVDNHMIVMLMLDGKQLFLDPTHPNLAFGTASPFIQDKEVLVNRPEGAPFQIAKVQVIPASNNLFYDSCGVRIINKDIVGEGVAMLSGYARMDFMDGLKDKSYSFLLKYCRPKLLKGSNNFIIDTLWLENVADKDKSLIVRYRFKIPNYIVVNGDVSYINLNLNKISVPSKKELTRNVPVSYRFTYSETNIVSMDMSAYALSSPLPGTKTCSNDMASFHNTFILDKGVLTRRQSYSASRLLITPGEFAEYNALIDTIQTNFQTQIAIKSQPK